MQVTLRAIFAVSFAGSVAAAGVLSSGAALGEPRRGRVVRVERPRQMAVTPVRGCLGLNPDASRFTCFGGEPPEPGEDYRVIDERGQLGVARVVKTEASVHDQCKAGVAHDVELAYEAGPTRSPSTQGITMPVAVSGVEADDDAAQLITDTSRLRAPSGRQENVWIAIDRDGDQAADFMATAREDCDEALSSTPPAPAGRSVHSLCLDYWIKQEGTWELANRDVFYNCY